MKVRIETTLILNDEEIKAARKAFEEFREGDETFRQFIKSDVEYYAQSWQQRFLADYMGASRDD